MAFQFNHRENRGEEYNKPTVRNLRRKSPNAKLEDSYETYQMSENLTSVISAIKENTIKLGQMGVALSSNTEESRKLMGAEGCRRQEQCAGCGYCLEYRRNQSGGGECFRDELGQ